LLEVTNNDLESQKAMICANNYSAFGWAAKNGHTNIVDSLLKAMKKGPEQQKIINELVTWAAKNGSTDIVTLLLEVTNNDLESQKAMICANNYNAVICAAKNKHTDVIKLLLDSIQGYPVTRDEIVTELRKYYQERNEISDYLEGYLNAEAVELDLSGAVVPDDNLL